MIEEFEVVTDMAKFFEKFKKKTELVSATSIPLVNLFIREVLFVDIHLRNWSTKPMFLKMVKDMKTKYDKYWGAYNKMNDFMYFAVLLDPTTKSPFLLHAFKKLIGYMEPLLTPASIDIKAHQMQIVIDCDDDNDFFGDFLSTGGGNPNPMDSELQTYLKENTMNYKKRFFNSRIVESKHDYFPDCCSDRERDISDTNLKCGVQVCLAHVVEL
uniref:hAT-like transposase RNase-H fold domain-containing protein n=1 Tax=Lactuca sativa TaxID=4236 RepID=A0A9R1UKE0_LACSA|nr:hypothetical protein LSAT_V11C900480850 [Lactuca sativa]